MSDHQRWRRLTELFHAAAARPAAERRAYLARECGNDHELRAEIEALLAADTSLETEVPSDSALQQAEAGSRIPPFRWLVIAIAVVATISYVFSAIVIVRYANRDKDFGWLDRLDDAGNNRIVSVSSDGPAAKTLIPGDLIIAFDGDVRASRILTIEHRRQVRVGANYSLDVIRQGRPMHLVLAPRNRIVPTRTDPIVFFVVSLSWCFVGVFIGWCRPNELLARLASLGFVSTSFVLLRNGLRPIGLWFDAGGSALFAFANLFSASYVALIYDTVSRFPSGVSDDAFRRRLRITLYWFGLVVLVMTQIPTSLSWIVNPELAEDILYRTVRWMPSDVFLVHISHLTGSIGGLIVVVTTYLRLKGADQRRRLRWLACGCLLGVVPIAGFWAQASTGWWVLFFDRTTWWTAGNFASIAIPASFAYSIVRYRLFDISVVIRRGIRYLLAKHVLSFLLSVPILLLGVSLFRNRDLRIVDVFVLHPGYAMLMTATAFTMKFRTPVRTWLDRRFFREAYDTERLVTGLLNQLDKVDSMRDAARLVAVQLDLALHPTAFHVYYRASAENHPAVIYSSSNIGGQLPSRSDLDRVVTDIIDVRDSARRRVSSRDIEFLRAINAVLIVPLIHGSDVIGLLLLGEKKSEQPYSSDDRRLLGAIAKQMILLDENLRLRAQVTDESRRRFEVLSRFDHLNLAKECPDCGRCFDRSTEVCENDGRQLSVTLAIERVIDGRYRLDRVIGKGGQGRVYVATDLRLERTVAIKVMTTRLGDSGALRRFEREARALAKLSHPNIIGLFDYGTLGGDSAYLVMEYWPSESMRAHLSALRILSGPRAAEWFDQILSGVEIAHAHGVVHRDLKPENVLVSEIRARTVLKIVDFGIAKSTVAGGFSTNTLTNTGMAIGTLGYMSPEQLSGADVDERSDIFTIGVMVFEAVAGRRPFKSDSYVELVFEVLNHHVHLPANDPDVVRLDSVLQRCLATRARDRYTSIADLRNELIPALAEYRSLPGIPVMSFDAGTTGT